MSDASPDERLQAHTVRLELVDRPGELLRALEPVAENGGNLLSIYHERGSLTPRGHIPVEIDLECPPDRFGDILDALEEAGVAVIQTDADHYAEQVTVVLSGDLIGTDLSDTISRIESTANASVVDVALSAPEGTANGASARLQLAAARGGFDEALAATRAIADEKGLRLVEPLVEQ
ncbi:MAG: amino acid-binding protein [Halobacteriaceae archaeon]